MPDSPDKWKTHMTTFLAAPNIATRLFADCRPIFARSGTEVRLGVCSNQYLVAFSSPSALLASLRTSTFQARNRTSGTPMTLIKKRDVAAHFAARRRNPNQIHIVPVSPPDTTGLPAKEPSAVDTSALKFNEDFVSDHSSRSAPLKPSSDSKAPKVPPVETAFGRGNL